jgi:hypothetical protein
VRWNSVRRLQKGALPAFIRFTLLFQFSEMLGSADCRQDGDCDRSGAPNSIVSRELPSLKEANKLRGISPASQGRQITGQNSPFGCSSMKVLTYQRLYRHKRSSELLLCCKRGGSGIHRLDTFLPESMTGLEPVSQIGMKPRLQLIHYPKAPPIFLVLT